MYFNPSLGIYEGVILLKQGFYNYKYVLKNGELLIIMQLVVHMH